jgi:hypothetical protein
MENIASGKAYAFVVWSQTMGRQNKRFIKEVKRFLEARPEVTAYYFNADSLVNL